MYFQPENNHYGISIPCTYIFPRYFSLEELDPNFHAFTLSVIIVICRITTGIVLRNVLLGDFVMQTS